MSSRGHISLVILSERRFSRLSNQYISARQIDDLGSRGSSRKPRTTGFQSPGGKAGRFWVFGCAGKSDFGSVTIVSFDSVLRVTSRFCVVFENLPFDSFMNLIRAGDEDAAQELVRRFEGVIRREVRLRLDDRRLFRVFDSIDISQSVLTSFFARASTGQFKVESPEQLVRLLIGITRNKVAFQVRWAHAQRRDSRLNLETRVDDLPVVSNMPGPSELASKEDLINSIRLRLGEEERQLADLRAAGWEWPEIANRLGGSPRARRMQLTRAVHRVAKTLRLDDECHG
jgi:ECF sigma factor